jgi:hypothetical protein
LAKTGIAAIETDILYDTGAVINVLPFKAGAYEECSGLMHELRRGPRLLKPETRNFLAKARSDLSDAKKLRRSNWPKSRRALFNEKK